MIKSLKIALWLFNTKPRNMYLYLITIDMTVFDINNNVYNLSHYVINWIIIHIFHGLKTHSSHHVFQDSYRWLKGTEGTERTN